VSTELTETSQYTFDKMTCITDTRVGNELLKLEKYNVLTLFIACLANKSQFKNMCFVVRFY
jgi:hypothetical protein